MSILDAAGFTDFFLEVHGVRPFPWQQRLVSQLLADRRWPDVLALPTGTGKTSVLDIGLYCLACAPERFARRIVLVIDRRAVVDQGADRAAHVLEVMSGPHPGRATQLVASALRAIWGAPDDAAPFEVAVMRGGMPRDDAWAARPDRPVVAVSTVDQVGSRLLFRGYGVSERMASVHAGLIGNDTVILLDEVHLSVPFAQTLMALRDRWQRRAEQPLPNRWDIVRMSATPGATADGDVVFRLDETDREDAVLARRLTARKLAALQVVSVPARDDENATAAFVRDLSACAVDHASRGSRVVGVVVNRVDTARRVALALTESAAGEVCLLTGRMRALDRDEVMRELRPRIESGRTRNIDAKALFVVATQCIEAGADFDFDALVTECASLDALQQRFGRLDRLGQLGVSPASVLVRSTHTSLDYQDPVYESALANTWLWLQQQPQPVDFGIEAMAAALVRDGDGAGLFVERQQAPLLLPTYIDLWAHTHPRPHPDPDPADWLHGPGRSRPDVQLVWRADITADDLRDAEADEGRRDDLIRRLVAVPPSSLESITIPIYAARQWLEGRQPESFADVVERYTDADEVKRGPNAAWLHPARLALQWRVQDTRVVAPADIRPGATLVVPAEYGGIALRNWSPTSTDVVSDVGDWAQWRQRGRATLRIERDLLPPELLAVEATTGVLQLGGVDEEAAEVAPRRRVQDWLRALTRGLPQTSRWKRVVDQLHDGFRLIEHAAIGGADGGGFTVVATHRVNSRDWDAPTEDDGASFTAKPRAVTLQQHSRDVWRWAAHFARSVGLPERLAADLILAAWLHDVGKADARFQKWMCGGDEVRFAALPEALAKSQESSRDWMKQRLLRQRAGYPEGYRHELLSVAMVQGNSALAQASDPELVLHLIGSHHGWCRPFAPAVDDEADDSVRLVLRRGPNDFEVELGASTRHRLALLDSGVADRFWRLNRRYGWWGLAWLEALLRLADHRASAEGSFDEE